MITAIPQTKTLPLISFTEELRFEFPDLPQPLFDYYCVEVARIMASEGHLFKTVIEFHTKQNVTRYLLDTKDESEIIGIYRITSRDVNTTDVYIEVDRTFTKPQRTVPTNLAWFDTEQSVLHVKTVYEHGVMNVYTYTSPVLGACSLPEVIRTKYWQTFMLGVKGKLLLITGRQWTNLQLGQAYYTEFKKQLAIDSITKSTNGMVGVAKINFGRAL